MKKQFACMMCEVIGNVTT